MVVGKGLLANCFRKFETDDSVIIFASGVSNSQETDSSEFEREYDLLKQYNTTESLLIYFSTCSIIDFSLTDSHYIKHKLAVEKFIQKSFKNYNIFRLPIVVGWTPNPHTLANYIAEKIRSKKHFVVHSLACRYIIDADDVGLLIDGLINSKKYTNTILNINFDNRIFIKGLVSLFEKHIGTTAVYDSEEKGFCYTPDNSDFKSYLKSIKFTVLENYNELVIQKYFGKNS